MIYESLIAPSETPNTLLEIKRALLTYDKVKLIDPSDRDVMPSTAYMSTIIGMPLIGVDMGAVRPMGKSIGYDNIFERIIDKCQPAIQQGLIEVIKTYDIADTKGALTIGAVPTGGYPLNTQFVFWLYRSMAQDQDFLANAISVNKYQLLASMEHSPEMAMKGIGDGGINNAPALPLLIDEKLTEDQNKYLTDIARARISSVIKYSGYCEAKDLVPVFSGSTYGGIVANLLNNAQMVLSGIESDPFWMKRNRILELCHEEFLDEAILDSMSIDEVIKLRSKSWGNQAKAREALFSSIGDIALGIDDHNEFQSKAAELIGGYRKESEELIRERSNVHFKIKCDLGIASLGGGTALIGLLSQLASPLASIGVTMAAGGMWAFDKSKEYIPALKELKAREQEIKRGAGFGIHDFYSRLK